MFTIILWIGFILSSGWALLFSAVAFTNGWGTRKVRRQNIFAAIITYSVWVSFGLALFGI